MKPKIFITLYLKGHKICLVFVDKSVQKQFNTFIIRLSFCVKISIKLSQEQVMSAKRSDTEHIRHCLLYEFQLKRNASKAHANITSLFCDVLSPTQCYEWFKRFKSGDYSLKDLPKKGRSQEVDDVVLKELIESVPRLSTVELSAILGAHRTTIGDHLKSIGKVSRAGIWVPHELSPVNLLQRASICASLSSRQQTEPFLKRIVTGDEKWVLYVNVERKRQWLDRGQKPLPTAKPGLHPKKVLLYVWWDWQGVLYFELLDQNQTITADIYCQQLDKLKTALASQTTSTGRVLVVWGVILQQDNARPHTAKITREKLKGFGWEVLPYPAYSPDIAPSDYWLFRSLQSELSGKNFKTKEEVETAITKFFASKDSNFYREGIERLPERWQTVADNDGQYIT